jgi:hypothetical protein
MDDEGKMKLNSEFWVGLIAGFAMIFFFVSCNQTMEGTAVSPGGILTGEGILAVIALSILATLLCLAFLRFLVVFVGRRNKRDAGIAYGLPDDSPDEESPMEYIDRHRGDRA